MHFNQHSCIYPRSNWDITTTSNDCQWSITIGRRGQSEGKRQFKVHFHERRKRVVWCDMGPSTCHTMKQTNKQTEYITRNQFLGSRRNTGLGVKNSRALWESIYQTSLFSSCDRVIEKLKHRVYFDFAKTFCFFDENFSSTRRIILQTLWERLVHMVGWNRYIVITILYLWDTEILVEGQRHGQVAKKIKVNKL